ncbi:alpha-tubulin [Orobanche minor]
MLKLRILMKKWPKNIGGIIWIVMILLLLMFVKVDRKSLVSVLGLPNHMTYADFFLVLWFFYPSFIGNANSQGLEDRYSILIRLYDQNSAGCKQAGIQVGNSYWELYCLEHGILQPDAIARLVGNVMLSTPSLPKLVRGSMSQELYLLILNQLYDEVRTRKYHQLFHPKQLISGRKMLPTISQRALYRRKFEFLGLMRDFGRAYCQAGKVSQGKIALGVAVKTLGLYKE